MQLLDRLLIGAERGARRGSMIGLLILRALALDAQGCQRDALSTLAHALGLAAPEGYRRVFVDEGAPMRELLARAVQEQGWDVEERQQGRDLRAYAQHLLAVG